MTDTIAMLFRTVFDVLAVLAALGIAIAAVAAIGEQGSLIALLIAGVGFVLWVLTFGLIAVVLKIADDLRIIAREAEAATRGRRLPRP